MGETIWMPDEMGCQKGNRDLGAGGHPPVNLPGPT